MDHHSAFYLINTICSLAVVVGVMWATHSRHICDGIFIKISLIGLALGCLAQGLHPTRHSALMIVCSLAAMIVFFLFRLYWAKLHNQKPVFLSL